MCLRPYCVPSHCTEDASLDNPPASLAPQKVDVCGGYVRQDLTGRICARRSFFELQCELQPLVETQDGGGIAGGLALENLQSIPAERTQRHSGKLSVTHARGTPRWHACPQLTTSVRGQRYNTSKAAMGDLAMPELRTSDPGEQQRFLHHLFGTTTKNPQAALRWQARVGCCGILLIVLVLSRNISCAPSLQLLCNSLCLPEYRPSAPSA